MNAISQSLTGLQNKTLFQINKKQNKQTKTHTQEALPRDKSGGTHLQSQQPEDRSSLPCVWGYCGLHEFKASFGYRPCLKIQSLMCWGGGA